MFSLVAIVSIGILSYCAWLVATEGVDDTKGADYDAILADDVDWFNAGDIPALAVAEDELVNGSDRVATTECGTATPDGGTNPTDGDGLDPMGCTDVPVGICWNNSVIG